jgi:hypothetical protein
MVARAAERCTQWHPGDWPRLAVELLLAEVDDPEVAELDGLPASTSSWETEPLVSALYERYDVQVPQAEDAVDLLGRLLTTELRARPANVTAPMIRLLAQLALPGDESELAMERHGCAEYLDCDCVVVNRSFEAELEDIKPLHLPDGVVQVLARPLRSTLPVTQPLHGHRARTVSLHPRSLP